MSVTLDLEVKIPDPSKPTVVQIIIDADGPDMEAQGQFPAVQVLVKSMEQEPTKEAAEGR